MPKSVIRDQLLTSERYWACSSEARNLYISVLLSADDTGRFTGSNFALRTRCMAGTVSYERIENLLEELLNADLVRIYYVDGARFIFIPRFRQYPRYINSKYPPPPDSIADVFYPTNNKKQRDSNKKAAPKQHLGSAQVGEEK